MSVTMLMMFCSCSYHHRQGVNPDTVPMSTTPNHRPWHGGEQVLFGDDFLKIRNRKH